MSRLQMPRISGAVPTARYGSIPIGGSPQQIQQAFNRNQGTADEINRGIGAATERGYQDVLAYQDQEQNAVGQERLVNASRARQHQDMMQGRVADLRGRVMPTYNAPGQPTGGALGPMQDAFEWLTGGQGLNKRATDWTEGQYTGAMEDVRSLGQTERMDLEERYRQAQGESTQNLARRGLGNSTIRSQQERGIDFDRARASTALNDSLTRERLDVRGRFGAAHGASIERAGERARDQQNLIAQSRMAAEMGLGQMDQQAGLAGMQAELGQYDNWLGGRERGIDRNTALGRDQLQWMNSIQAPYPNAGQYAALASAAGQAGVDQFGGGGFGGGAGGGMTRTRGAPWAGGQPTMGQNGGGPGAPPAGSGGPIPNWARGGPSGHMPGMTPGHQGFLENQAMATMPAYIPGPSGQMVSSAWAGAHMPQFVNQYVQGQVQGGQGLGGGILAGVPSQGGGGGAQGYAPPTGEFGPPPPGTYGVGPNGEQIAPTYEGAGEDWLLDQQLAQEAAAPVDWLFGSDVA